MVLTIIIIIAVFVFFGFLILNSKEVKSGDAKKNRKQLYWIFGIATIFVVLLSIAYPLLLEEQSETAQKVLDELVSEYGEHFSTAKFVNASGETKITILGSKETGSTTGTYIYEVTDKKGNKGFWEVDWQKIDGTITITEVEMWKKYR